MSITKNTVTERKIVITFPGVFDIDSERIETIVISHINETEGGDPEENPESISVSVYGRPLTKKGDVSKKEGKRYITFGNFDERYAVAALALKVLETEHELADKLLTVAYDYVLRNNPETIDEALADRDRRYIRLGNQVNAALIEKSPEKSPTL